MEDSEIIQRILKGDTNAYTELVHKYKDRVFRLCVSMLSEATQAEEAAQEVFIKAYEALARFRGQSSFSTWIYQITSHHCLDLLRKRARQKSESWEALVEREGEKIYALLSEAPSKDAFEHQELVQKVLSHLPADYRIILTLREVEELSYQEIAQTLGCSLDAVKARLKRAREDFAHRIRHFLGSKNV